MPISITSTKQYNRIKDNAILQSLTFNYILKNSTKNEPIFYGEFKDIHDINNYFHNDKLVCFYSIYGDSDNKGNNYIRTHYSWLNDKPEETKTIEPIKVYNPIHLLEV